MIKSISSKLLYFIITSFSSTLVNASSDESVERNWRQSLNITYKGFSSITRTDDWIKSTQDYMTDDFKIENIQPYLERPIFSNNIATMRFSFYYKLNTDETVRLMHFFSSYNKIFLSGMSRFREEVAQEDKDKTVLSHQFYRGGSSAGREINQDLTNQINQFINSDHIKEGTHSESLMLLHIRDDLPEMLMHIAAQNADHKVLILGSLLTVSSLKDPCGKSCMPMFDQFNTNFATILQQAINNSIAREKLFCLPNLERLILIAANVSYLESRNSLDLQEVRYSLPIQVDFDNPQVRIYSSRFEDLQ